MEGLQCGTGCAPILTIAGEYVGQMREMLADGIESAEVIEWVTEKVQDTCIDRLISPDEDASDVMGYDFDDYWQCMAYSEMIKRVDADYALFAWIQEYLKDGTNADPHAGCGDMMLKVTELGINNKIPGVTASLKDKSFTIDNLPRKYELRDSMVGVPGLMFGAGFLSLLSKGTEIVASMCFDYVGRIDQDVAGFIDVVTNESAQFESIHQM